MTKQIYKIDAEGKILGRIASEAAKALRGKMSPEFARNLNPNLVVEIANASKMKISPLKLTSKTYARYSGYPGGLKFPSLATISAKHGFSEVLRLAVKGMLPANKLRPRLMINLHISE